MRRMAAILDAVAPAPLVDRLLRDAEALCQQRRRFRTRLDLRGLSSLACEDGAAWSRPVPNFPQNQTCHEKRRSPRAYVIIWDGTVSVLIILEDLRILHHNLQELFGLSS